MNPLSILLTSFDEDFGFLESVVVQLPRDVRLHVLTNAVDFSKAVGPRLGDSLPVNRMTGDACNQGVADAAVLSTSPDIVLVVLPDHAAAEAVKLRRCLIALDTACVRRGVSCLLFVVKAAQPTSLFSDLGAAWGLLLREPEGWIMPTSSSGLPVQTKPGLHELQTLISNCAQAHSV